MLDTVLVLSTIVLPIFARGVIIRRPWAERWAARLNLDLRAVKLLQRLRRKYGSQPLLLRIPYRPDLLLLAPEDVDYVLQSSPDPFATATREKRAALSHLESNNVLISDPPERVMRRPYHEQALATQERIHPLAERFKEVIDEEIAGILDCQKSGLFGHLDWNVFSAAWFRIVRRVVLGDGGRQDEALTQQVNRLRSRANWAFLLRKDEGQLRAFQQKLRVYVDRAEPGSLLAAAPKARNVDPESQVAQWLFAFDPTGMATFKTLALLATHPHYLRQARNEASLHAPDLPFTRTCLLEALRLWPTTPAILREITDARCVDGEDIDKGTGVLIFTPFFHRDDERWVLAHRMDPETWNSGNALPAKGLVPFSAGRAICPAHNLVPLLASLTLAAVISRVAIRLVSPVLNPKILPATLNHFDLRFEINHLPVDPSRATGAGGLTS
ncbi:cytochrome P450 [Rhizobium deserti]|uniref:cytochrome P450 n=1 Tax=Rhizobium deserti TaxID=2547961 RepID=UPI001FE0C299|nr:cytochrome P450 [Rhizobium deserti]